MTSISVYDQNPHRRFGPLTSSVPSFMVRGGKNGTDLFPRLGLVTGKDERGTEWRGTFRDRRIMVG